MNGRRLTDAQISKALRAHLPDRAYPGLRERIIDEAKTTGQQRALPSLIGALGEAEINTPFRIAVAAAAVLVIALIGFNLLPRTPGVVGGPPSTLVPTATPAPTPVPTLPLSVPLAPGTYRSDFVVYTLPAGWSAFQGVGANKLDGAPPNGMIILPWRGIATVYHDPCHWQTTAVAVGPTVDALVTALAGQNRGSIVTPIDVTIDGFHGKQVDLIVPLGVNFAACDAATYKSFTNASGDDRYNQGPGQHDVVDILDVNGQPLAILTSFYAATSAADRAELQAIVDSMKITPPPPVPTATAGSNPSPSTASTLP